MVVFCGTHTMHPYTQYTIHRQILPELQLKERWLTSFTKQKEWKQLIQTMLQNIFEIGKISLELHVRGNTKHFFLAFFVRSLDCMIDLICVVSVWK